MGTSCMGTTVVDEREENFINIFFFLFDVAIANAYILLKSSGSCFFKDLKSFWLQIAKDLISEYCNRRRIGHGGTVIHPLPFQHYTIRQENEHDGSRQPRGHCILTIWFCCVISGVPYRRCKCLFNEMAHTTTCITLDSLLQLYTFIYIYVLHTSLYTSWLHLEQSHEVQHLGRQKNFNVSMTATLTRSPHKN